MEENETTTSQEDNEKTATELVTLALNESDSLFAEIRNQHLEEFGTYLQNQAKAMRDTRMEFKETGKRRELSELQKFVKQVPGFNQNVRSLENHVNLAELVKRTSEEATFRERWQMERTMLEGDLCLDDLDDLVACSYPVYRFLRLLCLQSLCKNGINSSRYDSLRKDVVQTYGYEYLSVLVNLEKAGLIQRKEAFLGMEKPASFSRLTELLDLINAEVEPVEPVDIAYVSSGYAPLTVRLLQAAVTGWRKGRDDIMRELPGRFVDILQQYPPEDLETAMRRAFRTRSTYGSLAATTKDKKKPVLIVLYVGGVTYMELAALRFLSKQSSFPYHLICCTTKIINGNTFLESLRSTHSGKIEWNDSYFPSPPLPSEPSCCVSRIVSLKLQATAFASFLKLVSCCVSRIVPLKLQATSFARFFQLVLSDACKSTLAREATTAPTRFLRGRIIPRRQDKTLNYDKFPKTCILDVKHARIGFVGRCFDVRPAPTAISLDHFEHTHHLVVFMRDNVTVPDVTAKLVKFGSDLGDLIGQGRDDILSSSLLRAVLWPRIHYGSVIGESSIIWEQSPPSNASRTIMLH